MLHLTSWMTTLPIMVIGMVSIVLVIGVIVLAVMFLNKLTSRNNCKGLLYRVVQQPLFYLSATPFR